MGSLSSGGSGSSSGAASVIAGGVISRVPQLEPTATNLCLQSAAYNVAPWVTAGGLVVGANTKLAPNGVVEADTLTDAGGGLGQVQQDIVVANDGTTYTHSEYIQAGTSTQCKVGLLLTGGVTPVDNSVEINPVSGVILAQTGAAATVETVTIGAVNWFRVSIPATNNTTGNVTCRPYIQAASAGAGAVGTIFVWGAQVEANSTPTSAIPTFAAAVVRAAGRLANWLLDFGTQTTNTVLAGPAAGGAATAAFRALVAADLPLSASVLTSTLGADQTLATGNFTDIVSVAQGITGTWLCIANCTATMLTGANHAGWQITDGVTTIDSGLSMINPAGSNQTCTLIGIITNPAGNIKVQGKSLDTTINNFQARFNATGKGKDTSLTVIRIG